jgi:hypothetical protein
MNKDHPILGFILGLLVPVLGMYLYYLLKFMSEHISVADSLNLLKNNHYMIPKVISLGLITCIPLITYYKNRKRMKTLKGIFAAIIIYGLIAVMYRFNIL